MQEASPNNQFTNNNSSPSIVIFDANIYSLNIIKKAAYKFTNRAFIKIENTNNGSIEVQFNFVDNIPTSEHKIILGEFTNEVLDQDLREIISKETEDIRKLIMAQAFSKTSLID